MPSVTVTFRGSLRLLATRRFGTFWFASLLSNIGTWAQLVAEPWLLLTLGASSFLVGLDSFAMNAPIWLLTLLGGALADRADRRRVITLFQSAQMLCPAAIVALLATGHLKPWMIIALSVVVGVTDALSMPSFSSIVPSIVSREQIEQGIALNSTQFNLSRILGPALAGVLMASAGALSCFAVSAASYVPFIGVALWILPRWTPPPHDTSADVLRRPLSGVAEILKQRELRYALLTVLCTGVLCSPLLTFAPVLVRDALHGDARHFSTTVAAFGLGGLFGAGGLLAIPPSVDRRRISSAFALAYGIVIVLCAQNTWLWSVPFLFVLAGVVTTVSNTAANSFLQTAAEHQRLGQTVSLYMLAMRGGMSLGALLTGALAGRFGVQHALLFDGVSAVAVQALVAHRWFASRDGKTVS